jgi:hypothetical protein
MQTEFLSVKPLFKNNLIGSYKAFLGGRSGGRLH